MNAEPTPVERAVKSEWSTATGLLQRFAEDSGVATLHEPELEGAIFCGHLVADLDSIAGALGAATLYGGTPARASEVNSETEFALRKWGVPIDTIPPIQDLVKDDTKICLVDFQQTTQLHTAIKPSQIVGIIDHHALQASTIVTDKPIFVDIRPFGSMSTIIAHSFVVYGKPLPLRVAGLLLCAIVSDTLNLRSPTTTGWDRKMVALLVQYCKIDDINALCAAQFRAKSQNLTTLSAYQLVSGDLKRFKLGGDFTVVVFSVIETTDPDAMLSRVDDLLPEMRVVKAELPAALIFVAIVDIVNLQSHLLIAGTKERALANHVGWAQADSKVVQLASGLVSRKADFIPPLTKAFNDGWTPPTTSAPEDLDLQGLEDNEVVIEADAVCPGGRFVRRPSIQPTPRSARSSKKV